MVGAYICLKCGSELNGPSNTGECGVCRRDARIAELEAEREELRGEILKWISDEVTGPRRGVVEDVEDLRAERDALLEDKARLDSARMGVSSEGISQILSDAHLVNQ